MTLKMHRSRTLPNVNAINFSSFSTAQAKYYAGMDDYNSAVADIDSASKKAQVMAAFTI